MSQRSLVIQALHKNLQRLASLALCTSGSDPVRPTTAIRLGQRYRDILSRRVLVETADADQVLAYLSERALIRKYGARNTDELRKSITDGRVPIEVQDCWLSDPSLRSQTGGEREQSFAKTVTVCQELGLLAPRTLTITSYGRLLLDVAQEHGVLASAQSDSGNPFKAVPAYAIAAFYRFAASDLPMQLALADVMADGRASFQEVSLRAEAILKNVSGAVPNSPATRPLHAWLMKEIDNARKLAARVRDSGWSEAKGAAVQTLYRPFEDMFLPRLEFLVDVGLVEKPEPARYVYAPSPDLDGWRDLLRGGLQALESTYFSVMAEAHHRRSERLTEPDHILKHLSSGYAKYRGRTGYAPILEAVMYANTVHWDADPWLYIEVRDSLEALRALSTGDQPVVRLLSDRYRKPEAFSVAAA